MSRRELALICATGVALRLLLLWLSGNPDPAHDEKNYVFLALQWNHFGVAIDRENFLWPPGYLWLLGRALAWFGSGGLLAMKLFQCGAEALGIAAVVALAQRWFPQRALQAARAAGWMAALFLPAATYSHFLYSESLFGSLFAGALACVVAAAAELDERRALRRAVAAGLFAGAAILFREIALYLTAVLIAWLAFAAWQHGTGAAVRRALTVALAAVAIVLPWSLRNTAVYGRSVPVALTLGQNCFLGINANYRNLEVNGVDGKRGTDDSNMCWPWLIGPPESEPWSIPTDVPNAVERMDAAVATARQFVADHPAWVARLTLQKEADLLAPRSFLLRQLVLGDYPGPIAKNAIARPLIALSVVEHVAVFLLALLGGCALASRSARWFAALLIGAVLASGFIVAMSRYFLPALPMTVRRRSARR